MDRAQRAGVACIQQLEQIERLASSNFPQQNTIGPVPERSFEKVANRYRRYPGLLTASLEANEIRMNKLYLRCVFD